MPNVSYRQCVLQEIKEGKITRPFNQTCSFPRPFSLLNQEIQKVCVCIYIFKYYPINSLFSNFILFLLSIILVMMQ